LHLAGKTDEARADLARLALIRKQREEAAKKREDERKGIGRRFCYGGSLLLVFSVREIVVSGSDSCGVVRAGFLSLVSRLVLVLAAFSFQFLFQLLPLCIALFHD